MALYDYRCIACRNEFDLVRPMSEAGETATCPRCGAEARRVLAPGAGTEGLASASGLEPKTSSPGGLPTDSIGEDTGHRLSAGSATAVAPTVSEEVVATDLDVVLLGNTAPLEMPYTTEYHPNGSNLWHIRDWGIASMFGYLRERRGTETADAAQDRKDPDQRSSALSETSSSADIAAGTHTQPTPSEWRLATSVMPWLGEMTIDPPEADGGDAGAAGDETDMPGFRPRRNRPVVQFAWAPGTKTKPAEERAAEAAGHPRPDREEANEDFPDEVIQAAWRRQGGRCANCGRWLVWAYRDRDITGAWESHCRISAARGGRATLANCVLLCSGVADCHFNAGHGGIAWSHHSPMNDFSLLFLSSTETTAALPATAARRRRNLLREVFGIPQSKKSQG